jgi:hypothetical protein
MALAKDDHMVEALTADRADQPLCITVLPARPRRGRPITNAHGANAMNESSAVDKPGRRFSFDDMIHFQMKHS